MKSKLIKKIKYKNDEILSKGTFAFLAMLIISTIIFLVLFALFLFFIAQNNQLPYQAHHALWYVFIHMLDPGTITANDTNNNLYIAFLIFITIFGIVLNSILVGTVTNAIESKLKSLRAGKAQVIESGHTIIFGLNDSAYTIINELNMTEKANSKKCIIVVSEEPHSEMIEKINSKIKCGKKTKIICRSGNGLTEKFLDICSLSTAKSVIINYDNDLDNMKQLLAVAQYREIKSNENPNFHVACLIREKKNSEPAKFIGGEFSDIIYIEDYIARLIAHVCRYPGIAKVFSEIFSYEDSEIYFKNFPELDNKTFRQVLLCFPRSTVLGLFKDKHNSKQIMLNPSPDIIYNSSEDDIILLAKEYNSPNAKVVDPEIDPYCKKVNYGIINNENRNVLVLGENILINNILEEFDKYVGSKSKVLIMDNEVSIDKTLIHNFKNIEIDIERTEEIEKEKLEKLIDTNNFDTVLLLCNLEESPDIADSDILVNIANLGSIIKTNNTKLNIISEMRSIENQKLLYQDNICDFVVGSNITSLIQAQVSENRYLLPIFKELLSEKGSEFYMKPITNYVDIVNDEFDLYQLQDSASDHNEIIVGLKLYEDMKYNVVINPEKCTKRKFSENDFLIVLAEN